MMTTQEEFEEAVDRLFNIRDKQQNTKNLDLDDRFTIDGDGNIDGVKIYLECIITDISLLDKLREYLADETDDFLSENEITRIAANPGRFD